jgi:osmotically inducible protein OsmC
MLETVSMKRNASATWVGDFRHGKGLVTTGSDTLSLSHDFARGDGERKGADPYELLAAAHAACFSMMLADELADAGFSPDRIKTTATVIIEQLPVGWTITAIQLDVLADVPRAKQSDFIRATLKAKTNCTISRLLKTNIAMSAKLEDSENRGTENARRSTHSLKVSKTKKQSIGLALPKVHLP